MLNRKSRQSITDEENIRDDFFLFMEKNKTVSTANARMIHDVFFENDQEPTERRLFYNESVPMREVASVSWALKWRLARA